MVARAVAMVVMVARAVVMVAMVVVAGVLVGHSRGSRSHIVAAALRAKSWTAAAMLVKFT